MDIEKYSCYSMVLLIKFMRIRLFSQREHTHRRKDTPQESLSLIIYRTRKNRHIHFLTTPTCARFQGIIYRNIWQAFGDGPRLAVLVRHIQKIIYAHTHSCFLNAWDEENRQFASTERDKKRIIGSDWQMISRKYFFSKLSRKTRNIFVKQKKKRRGKERRGNKL